MTSGQMQNAVGRSSGRQSERDRIIEAGKRTAMREAPALSVCVVPNDTQGESAGF
jgi:hypothetical protein